MDIPRLGIADELDPKTISKYSIVAVMGICNNTLAVNQHALERYHQKNDGIVQTPAEVESIDDLAELHQQLLNSKVVKRKNETKQFFKYGMERAMYRLEKGWLFVLVWKEKLKFWLLKTAYPLEARKMRGYKVVQTRRDIRAQTWTPSFCT